MRQTSYWIWVSVSLLGLVLLVAALDPSLGTEGAPWASSGFTIASGNLPAAPQPRTAVKIRGARTFGGSFQRETVTVAVSGGHGGLQVGPYANLSLDRDQQGRTLTVHIDRVVSLDGEELPPRPVHLYRHEAGEIAPGDELVAFSDWPVRQLEEVAAEPLSGKLIWSIVPGEYLLFFPWTRPIVRIPSGIETSTISYTVIVE